MNKFFKIFWAALLAVIVSGILFVVIGSLVFAGMLASLGRSAVTVRPGSVLEITLDSPIYDSPDSSPFGLFDRRTLSLIPTQTLLRVTDAIDAAAGDERIAGIYINLSAGSYASLSQLEELRGAVERFKTSGKFVIAYDEVYSQGGYYLASVADRVFLNPQGLMDWRGMAMQVMFYKGLIDKLDLNVEVLRHGTFKSAVEPFMTDRMSPANRLQMTTLAESLWGTVLDAVSVSRGIPVDVLNAAAENLSVRTPEEAVEQGFVDSLLYEDEVSDLLYRMSARHPGADVPRDSLSGKVPEIVTLGQYASQIGPMSRKITRNKVAVIYAEGDLISGDSYPGSFGSATVSDQIEKARLDDDVKAVVFRVNSPGGDALAAEVIWRKLELLRNEKPLIVSMGSYAASGGYYVSAPADVIMTDRTTLTGSIGVFGLMVDVSGTLKDKLGITVDAAKTNSSADMGPFRPLSGAEKAFLMKQIESVYRTFVTRVADGRNMTYEQVDKIAEGRVWSGADAEQIGLVDGFGGLSDAIALAAERAGISGDYRVYEITGMPSPLAALLYSMSSVRSSLARSELGDGFKYYDHVLRTLGGDKIQARLPYVVEAE